MRTLVGFQVFSAGLRIVDVDSSGQPSVDIGQRPEENQVSRTSGSCSQPSFSKRSIDLPIVGIAHAREREAGASDRRCRPSARRVASARCDIAIRPSLRPLVQRLDGRSELLGRESIRQATLRQSPHRNPMSPPQLPADAPVADVFVPGLEGLGVTRGVEAELPSQHPWPLSAPGEGWGEGRVRDAMPPRLAHAHPALSRSTGLRGHALCADREPSREGAAPASRSSVTFRYH